MRSPRPRRTRAAPRVRPPQPRSALGALVLLAGIAPAASARPTTYEPLPPPDRRGRQSLEKVLHARRSVREFRAGALTPQELSQLLWAAQGVTAAGGLRTAPSAGALYPLELYVLLPTGCFRYDPPRHRLERRADRDLRSDLQHAALGQRPIGEAPAVFAITAIEARTRRKYGLRTERYVAMEAGHAAQNLLLEATALGLGGVPMGAFDDDAVARLLGLRRGESPLYLIPVGHPR